MTARKHTTGDSAAKCKANGPQLIKRYAIYVEMICDLDPDHEGDHWEPTYLVYWPGNLAE